MKVWYGYGSDHSANLVMIGEFKTAEEASRVHQLIERLMENAGSDLAERIFDYGEESERFSESTTKSLRELGLNYLAPTDISDFAFWNPSISKDGKSIRFRSDEEGIGGFVKLLVKEGAKVEVYSEHEFPEDDSQT
jgi:hypothetical protein